MYVDGYFLLTIYIIAVLAAAISVYSLWTLKEIEEQFRKKSKPNNAWDHYHDKANQTTKPKSTAKGHFDKYR